MTIAWAEFTPWHSLAGGLLIGLAASVLLLANGKIAGISGILGNILQRSGAEPWRLAFVAGLLLSPLVLLPVLSQLQPSALVTPQFSIADLLRLLAGGFLVGLGTRMANGCTSGHGVCGLARLSPRSLAAVLTFMLAGFVTVFLWRESFGLPL
ncbi:YeeE/YedE [Kineobactrum sediminis]|uniref:YeeE/YedE n=1 Tax=Kineobactrum sediminis TaxID=1905677 RepID=A0A2N5Y6I9_9GAMM|nr:YeeE/YedE family protein [Kineobactrum sediminis]PLW84008.1 YeeE/YedE [Kineobactrum sediminis]